jgi:PhnB protein
VDEMDISLVPTLLGRGERLFEGFGDDLHGLDLVRTVAAPNVTHLKFSRPSKGRGRSGSPPAGWPTVTPRIMVHDAPALVEFVKHVFEATGDFQPDRPTIVRLGDSVILVSAAGVREPMRAFLYVYVDDVDGAHRRAIRAGATSLEEPSDLPYGDRRAMVRDPWGNTWQIASPRGNS